MIAAICVVAGPLATQARDEIGQLRPVPAEHVRQRLNHTNGLNSAIASGNAFSAWNKQIELWRAAEVYRKVSVGDLLIKHLGDGRHVRMDGFENKNERHNLNCVAGRAAAAIEAIYNVRITPVGPSLTKSELAATQREATLVLSAFREGASDMASEFGSHRPMVFLKRTYTRELTPRTHENADRQAVAMERLLADWYPIGKTPAELEAVAGPPSEKRGDVLEYRFDNGRTGICFDFRTEQGQIRAVTTWGLY